MQDQIFNILTNKDTVSWKSLIFEVIKNNNMDPWDVDISKLARQYIRIVKKMKVFDFFISGKVLIAASFLLRLKSVKLVDEDLMEFDRLIAQVERSDEDFLGEFYGGLEGEYSTQTQTIENDAPEQPVLIPRTPQPRKRKVSVYDLVAALQKALEVHERKVLRDMEVPKVKVPEKRRDITLIIRGIYQKIRQFFSSGHKRLTFSQLIPSHNKEDIIQTFVPLLHLSHASHKKIELLQNKPFGEIEIKLLKD